MQRSITVVCFITQEDQSLPSEGEDGPHTRNLGAFLFRICLIDAERVYSQ
jgi:hypothetical protein